MSIRKFKPSYDIYNDRLEKLKTAVPEAFADGKINWNILKECLGNFSEEEREDIEHYAFTWPGKRQARRLAGKSPQGTLVPALGEGVNENITQNIFIEGDNLEVLKLLQKSYAGRIKVIYIDPPYNTGSDLIYNDNFTQPLEDYLKLTGQINSDGSPLVSNKKADGRFHSKWISMMYPRLLLAKNLLKEDGVIFISIDDNEVDNLKKLCNEIFGEENFVECITWNKRVPKNDKGIGNIHEYVLIYLKSNGWDYKFTMPKEGLEEIYDLVSALKKSKKNIPEAEAELRKLYDKKGYDRGITLYNSLTEDYKIWGKINLSWPNANTFGPRYEVLHPSTKKPVKIPERGWRWKKDTFDDYLNYKKILLLHDGSFLCGSIWFDKDENTQPSLMKHLDDVDTLLLRSILSFKSDGGIEVENLFEGKSFFSYPKPTILIKVLISSLKLEDGDIVLDFFAGSCTSAHSLLNLLQESNKKVNFVMVQLPEPCDEKSEALKAGFKTIAEIGKERIRRVIKQIKESSIPEKIKDLDLGFKVYKLQPSHFKEWEDYGGQDVKELIELFSKQGDSLLQGWKPMNLLVEVMLQEGFPLNSKIESIKEIDKNKVYKIISDSCEHPLFICFDDSIEQNTIKALPLSNKDIFICLDRALTDEQKIILADKGVIKTI